jgi:hypothetical protein
MKQGMVAKFMTAPGEFTPAVWIFHGIIGNF